jgi:alkanesulfonate monooxygenase SsuD/methylene tetrahydromethanopterin reductase-like flavin-dependent oxidoreductase (luciferase family)
LTPSIKRAVALQTPVLYQAGASPRGRQFAAEHAECVFAVLRKNHRVAHS